MLSRRKSEHAHRWVNVAVNETLWEKTLVDGRKQTHTLVLQRCRCGAHNTDLVMGRWSREELGIDDERIRDLITLLDDLDD